MREITKTNLLPKIGKRFVFVQQIYPASPQDIISNHKPVKESERQGPIG